MSFFKYLKDKLFLILLFLFSYLIILLMLLAFKVDYSLVLAITFVMFLFIVTVILIDYFRKKSFYDFLINNTKNLDKKYLVLETFYKPSFYEGKILYEVLYDINKSMIENVKSYSEQTNDFKEYVEMWIHEIKIPISSLVLEIHNNKNKINKTMLKKINKIDELTEQILYYVRTDTSEKDYLIKQSNLNKIISEVALKNKDYLLENEIEFICNNLNYNVLTDSKWLVFILNQIINNSIKYKRNIKNSYIKIYATDNKDNIELIIEDNGIGILESDIPRVFEKSFTGYNGRIRHKSTGMGLFIAKNLCNKLGHKISIESVQNKYTKVIITFYKNEYYNVF